MPSPATAPESLRYTSLKCHNRLVRILILALATLPVFAASQTALDRYVAAPDPNYKYDLVRTHAAAATRSLCMT